MSRMTFFGCLVTQISMQSHNFKALLAVSEILSVCQIACHVCKIDIYLHDLKSL